MTENIGKAAKWLWDNGHKDTSFRYAVIFIIWVVVLSIAQVFSYRAIKIGFFEIPQDKVASAFSYYEPIELLEVFPYRFIFLPLVLVPVELIAGFMGWVIKWAEKQDYYFIKQLFKILEGLAPFVTVFLLIYWFFEKDPYFVTWVGFGLLFFGLFQAVIFRLFDIKSVSDSMGISTAGVLISSFIFAVVILGSSVFLLQRGMQSESQKKNYVASLCDRISLVSVATEATKIGWMLSRADSYFTMREKIGGVYYTTDTPMSSIKQIVYLERFGGGYSERIKAFPACDIGGQ